MCDRFRLSIRQIHTRIYAMITKFRKRKARVVPEVIEEFETHNMKIPSEVDLNSNEETSILIRLPQHLRKKVYDLLDFESLHSLAQVSSTIREDIGTVQGFRVTLLETSEDSSSSLIFTTGVCSLTIKNYPGLLPPLLYPDLLKELTINGEMDSASLNKLLTTASQMHTLRLNCDRVQSDQFFKFLEGVTCPSLNILCVRAIEEFSTIFEFVCAHPSLTSLLVSLQLMSTEKLDSPSAMEISCPYSTKNVKHLTLKLERLCGGWKQLLNAQHNLQHLNLQTDEALNWNDLGAGVLQTCCSFLQTLVVVNLSVQTGPPNIVIPVDLGFLRYCTCLQILSLSHQSQSLLTPHVAHSGSLPPTLRHLSLTNFRLKSHQESTILLKYPDLEILELSYWTENDECALSAFLSSINFLLLMKLSPVKIIRLLESNVIMQNSNMEIQSMRVNHCVFTQIQENGDHMITITPNSTCLKNDNFKSVFKLSSEQKIICS